MKKTTAFLDKTDNKLTKSIVYIDGFNLYYGISSLNIPYLKWLDIGKLAMSLLDKDSQTGCKIKYFTAYLLSDIEKQKRQKHYFKAIKEACNSNNLDFDIIYGKYLSKNRSCKKCGESYTTYEEKKTDVNIACHILEDLYNDNFDKIYLISGDSDLSLPINILHKKEKKKIVIVYPPGRKNHELNTYATSCYAIKKKRLSNCLLPNPIITKAGNKIFIPKEWDSKV